MEKYAVFLCCAINQQFYRCGNALMLLIYNLGLLKTQREGLEERKEEKIRKKSFLIKLSVGLHYARNTSFHYGNEMKIS
jgi:hypothetical protein